MDCVVWRSCNEGSKQKMRTKVLFAWWPWTWIYFNLICFFFSFRVPSPWGERPRDSLTSRTHSHRRWWKHGGIHLFTTGIDCWFWHIMSTVYTIRAWIAKYPENKAHWMKHNNEQTYAQIDCSSAARKISAFYECNEQCQIFSSLINKQHSIESTNYKVICTMKMRNSNHCFSFSLSLSPFSLQTSEITCWKHQSTESSGAEQIPFLAMKPWTMCKLQRTTK